MIDPEGRVPLCRAARCSRLEPSATLSRDEKTHTIAVAILAGQQYSDITGFRRLLGMEVLAVKPKRSAIVVLALALLSFPPTSAKSAPPKASPFKVWEKVSCSSPLTAGVAVRCTIRIGIINQGKHRLSFAHTVITHLARNVRVISTSTTSGTIVTSGSDVIWSRFQVLPGVRATASIQVSFTPTAAQVSSNIVLSTGIDARAVDVATGKRLSVRFGSLAVQPRVRAGGSRKASSSGRGGRSRPGALPKTGGA